MTTPAAPTMVVLSLVFLTSICSTSPAQTPSTARLRGRVVDARSGEPIGKVKVIAGHESLSAITDQNGTFTIENVPTGNVDLYITTVNYGLVKKTIKHPDGERGEVQIVLNEDAATLTESVSISVDPYAESEPNAPSEHMLNKRELQSLSSILIGDPVRAAQSLPGVATGDDFRSEFSLRGAGFDRIGLYLDGILTENFVHTIQGGYSDTGSLSVINADTVRDVGLLSGAFPAKFGNRTASVLDIQTRDGNRIKPTGRVTLSLSGVAGVVDGPFSSGRGSYLFAGRKSYVGYLIRKLNEQNQFTNNPPILDLADFQGKALYDVTKRNQVGFSLIFGELEFDRNRDRDLLFINTVFRGSTKNLLINGHWAYTPDNRTFWQTRIFFLRGNFRNINRGENVLDEGTRTQVGGRSDISFQLHPKHRTEGGVYLRRLDIESLNQSFLSSGVFFDTTRFAEDVTEQAYYVQDTWSDEKLGLSLTGGVRVEHSGITKQTLFSPRAALGWSVNKDWKLKAGVGRYYQFPDLDQMFGRRGNPALRAESATHYNASIERFFGDRMRISAEVYDREDRDLFFSYSEPRLVNNVFTFIVLPFRNSLNGHARGVEVTVQRRSANKLAGWFSYSYSRTQLTDSQTGFSFFSDNDQRHTVNVYGSYRFTDTWDMSSAWRYGSGQPIPGFYQQVGSDYFVTDQRNLARVPYYSRLDIRVSKAFLFKRWKLTVTGEVINLLNRDNVRFVGFEGFSVNGPVFGRLERMLPILPSVGAVIEF